jgi:hypothetical protein
LHDRQVSRFFAFNDATSIYADLAVIAETIPHISLTMISTASKV